MRSIAVFTIFLYLSAASAVAERTRAVRRSAELPAPASVLWIAAHPDDEAILAPLLAQWCLDDGARCGFLILTRGEKGECLLPAGCHPDVATVRSAEAGAASELFEANLFLLGIPDGGVAVAAAGDLSATIAGYIEAFRPETVITFDPRHGSTCHPDHRETARAVLAAVEQLSYSPELLFLETKVVLVGDPLKIRFAPATAPARRFDANASLTSTGETAWQMIVEDMLRHPSQFSDAWIRAIELIPDHQRNVWYGAADEMLAQEVAGCEP